MSLFRDLFPLILLIPFLGCAPKPKTQPTEEIHTVEAMLPKHVAPSQSMTLSGPVIETRIGVSGWSDYAFSTPLTKHGLALSRGQVFDVELPLPGLKTVTGKVTRIEKERVTIEFRAPPRLLDGTTVKAISRSETAKAATEDGALEVPLSAVLNPTGSQAYVYWIRDDDRLERSPVTVIETSRSPYVLLKTDIKATMPIVTSGQHKLFPGMRVKARLPNSKKGVRDELG